VEGGVRKRRSKEEKGIANIQHRKAKVEKAFPLFGGVPKLGTSPPLALK